MAALWSVVITLVLLQAQDGVLSAVLVDAPEGSPGITEPFSGTTQDELDTTPFTMQDTTRVESGTDPTEPSTSPVTEETQTATQIFITETTLSEMKQFEVIHPLNRTEIIDTKFIYKNSSQDSDNNIDKTYYEVDNKDIVPSTAAHDCSRECVQGGPSMKCHYTFTLEWYYTMSKACFDCAHNATDCDRPDCIPADGVKRPVIVVNRQMPGPSVEVCLGDVIVVDLVNNMMEETTTIHWHGHHQKGTPYMDGVPYVTQCPIPPKATFRYRYIADTSGTHFWHSHSGCQRADGAYGALIVRVPSDRHSKLYDFDLSEHIIQIIDWGHELGIDKFVAHHHSTGDNKPKTLLVNGRGWVGGLTNNTKTHMPSATFQVEQGKRYRFRLINSGFLNCPIEMSVDNHTLLVISSDGSDLQPVAATSLVSYAGERFDFILEANQSIDNYWMRFRGLMDCGEQFNKVHQVAVLHYHGTLVDEDPQGDVSYETSHRPGTQINSLNVGPGTNSSVVIPEIDSLVDDDISLKPEPDMKLFLSYDFHSLDNPHYHKAPYYGFNNVSSKKEQLYTPQFNHVSMKLLPFPLLSGRDLLRPDMLCNESTFDEKCKESYCECTHVVQVPLGAVLELILIDLGEVYDANHPFHLHGHAFRVIAMDRLGRSTTVEEVKQLDNAGLIKRKLSRAPIKDTVTVPDGGYTVIRIHAANPGYWLFHCHIEFHVELGMSVIFKVGEHSDIPPVPRGFPQCNDWMPDDIEEEEEEEEEEDAEGSGDTGHQILSSTVLLAALLVLPLLQKW